MSYKSTHEVQPLAGDFSILLIADRTRTLGAVRSVLGPRHRVEACSERDEAVQLADSRRFDCVLVDMPLAHGDAIGLLRTFRRRPAGPPVVLLCSAADISKAVEGVRAGAADFIIKDIEFDGLVDRIAKAVGRPPEAAPVDLAPMRPAPDWTPGQMVVGRSRRMAEVTAVVRRAAQFPVPVLILGESGTGKELLARSIHKMGARSCGPFVAVNLAAVPSELIESALFGHEKGAFTGAVGQRTGKFGQAQGGTLLLDEITELKLELQPKLLRVLQEGEFERVGGERTLRNDARIVAATNQSISALVQQGAFRGDLYYRLNVVTVTLPPLRERREDIPELAGLFLRKYNRFYCRSVRDLSSEATAVLMEHDWPGNIRELENVIQRAVIVAEGDEIRPRALLDATASSAEAVVSQTADFSGTLEDLERRYIEEVLRRVGGHQSNAARALGIDRKTLYNKILKYGLGRALTAGRVGDAGRSFRADETPCGSRISS